MLTMALRSFLSFILHREPFDRQCCNQIRISRASYRTFLVYNLLRILWKPPLLSLPKEEIRQEEQKLPEEPADFSDIYRSFGVEP